MNIRKNFSKLIIPLSLVLILTGAALVPQSARASMEDAAIFYDELGQHGEWVDYENYGPVWYPSQVQENWRPYVDGRWTPSEDGQVFETQEPWGWATYHYGNWMPTEEYGWVWVPGRTWYPNTVTWRTSPESEAPETSYIGWAPIPPPNYKPSPGYYPEGYSGGGSYGGSLDNLITAPFWIFVKAASFLMGFSQPYTPSYSYWGCNCLMPPPVVPYYVRRTVIVHNYYSPSYYPVGYFGAGRGYYNWGPSIPYVARVTRINRTTINNYVQQVNIYQRANVVPPAAVLARRGHFRDVLPPAMVRQQPLPRAVHVRDVQVARGNLARPNLVNANVIKNAPPINASIPKTRVIRGESGQWRRGVPGSALPAGAMMRPNREMENNIRKIPSSQRIEPVSPRARKWNVPQTPGAEVAQPVGLQKGRGPELPAAAPRPQSATVPRDVSPGMRPGPQGTAPAVAPGGLGAPPETTGRSKKAPTPEVLRPRTPGPSQAVVPGERVKAGKPQPGAWGGHEQTPPAVVSPRQTPGHGQKRSSTPGTPPSVTGAPVQVQQQQRAPVQQPQRQKKRYTPEQSQGFGSGEPGMTGVQPRRQPSQTPTPPRVQPQPQVQPQPRFQQRPQMQQAPPPQAPRQVQQQPRFQPKPQVQPQPQVQQQPRFQPRPQVQSRPQVQQQPRFQPRPQVQPQPRPQPQAQSQSRPQAPQQQQRGKQKPEQDN
jgi:hypothetical protein